MARYIKITMFLAIVTILGACSNGKAESPSLGSVAQNVEALEPALPLDENGQQIVARVNDKHITLAEFEREFERNRLISSTASYDAIAGDVINLLIERELIDQAARDLNVTITDEQVEQQFQEYRGMVADDVAWQDWLDQNQMTEDELRQSIRMDIITQFVVEQIVMPETNMQISEVSARHILVETVEEANTIIQRLDNGEDFAQLAAAFSKDVTTRDQGGDLGWFTLEDLLTPELSVVAFQLQINEIGGPVQTMLGYHIIQTLETNQRVATQEERSMLIANQFGHWLQSLRDGAVIEQYMGY